MDTVRSIFAKIGGALSGAKRWAFAHKVGAGVIVVVVLGGGYLAYAHYAAKSAGTEYVIGRATRGTLTVTVEGSGQVTANQQLDLSPKASGTVTSVRVKAGDQVTAGEVIATVDDTDAEKSLRDAYSSLQSAQISYQQSVASANNDTANAIGTALSSSATAMTDLPSMLQNLDTALNTMSNIPGHSDQQNSDAYAAIVGGDAGETMRDTAKSEYQSAKAAYQAALALSTSISRTSSSDDLDAYLAKVYAAAAAASQAENDTHELLQQVDNKLVSNHIDIPSSFSTILTQSATDESKANGDVSNVYSAKSSLESATATLAGSDNTFAMENAQLNLQKAQNSYQDAQTALSDYSVIVPFSGTIAKVNVQTNDQASSGTAVATLITNETYAELSLNEVDAAKVKEGQKVALTFDAIDGLTIPGTVAEVDSVGTVSQGVVTYDVKISFDKQDSRVKPGMTVDATITTDSVENALIVPSSAVTTVGSQSFVQVVTEGAPAASTTERANHFASSTAGFASSSARMRNASTSGMASTSFGGGFLKTMTAPTETVPESSVTVTRVPVTVGLSSDTETEITSGLTEGQAIVVRMTSGTTAVTTGTSGFGAARGNATFVGGGGGAVRAVAPAGRGG
jgi:multidrug efflux pump subunit AcrA (membrane-fusion protein)